MYQKKSGAEQADGFAWLLYLGWVHQIRFVKASRLLSSRSLWSGRLAAAGTEIFKIDSYTNLVLQYLRWKASRPTVFEKDWWRIWWRKWFISMPLSFIIQKGLTLNLRPALTKIIVTDKKWAVGRHWTNPLKQSQIHQEGGLEIYMEGRALYQDAGWDKK